VLVLQEKLENIMLKKSYSKTGRICRVTFKYNNPENAGSASLAGEFNNWSPGEHPMKKLKNGTFSVTLSLQAGNSYPFRYVLDGKAWVNDEAAHRYEPNNFGEDNSIVVV
jgi:1,4-alpha-glucan branching enzyme